MTKTRLLTNNQNEKISHLPQNNFPIIPAVINFTSLAIDTQIFPRLALQGLSEVSKFSRTCRKLHGLFQNPLHETKQLLTRLLLHVVRGQQRRAKSIIKQHPYLLLAKGCVTDYSGRTFKNITAFQYALWARDRHMWEMILHYLAIEKAREQLIELETEGTEYGQLYNYLFYEDKYSTYNKHLAEWSDREIKQFWIGDIGRCQRQVPAHVAQESCRLDRLLHRTQRHWKDYCSHAFAEKHLKRTFKLLDGTLYFPQSPGVGLGFEYAVTHDRIGVEPESNETGKAGAMIARERAISGVFDEAFILCLFSARNCEYKELRLRLGIEGSRQFRLRRGMG